MNESTSTSSSSAPSPTPAKRRINFGRRRSDWLVPLIFLTIAVANALWAYNNYLQRQDVEALKKGLEVQTQLRERQLRFYEKQLNSKAAAPKTTTAPARR
jgi:hypothetical protein